MGGDVRESVGCGVWEFGGEVEVGVGSCVDFRKDERDDVGDGGGERY